MRRHGRLGRVRCALVIALLVLGAGAWAQGGEAGAAAESEGDDLDALFDEAVIEDDSGDGDGGGLGSEDLDALFEEAVVEDDSGDGDGAGAAGRDGDLDALFDADVMGTADTGGDPIGAAAPTAGLLTRAGVDWGGSFRYDGTVELSFKDYEALSAAVAGDESAERVLRHDLAAVLYLDARPNRDFRVFAKGKAKADFASAGRDEADEAPEFAFTLFELFADFHWDDRVFFRAGKQRADWGVGRFFSPADLISLVTIDPLDPGAEREGPVAVKVHAPIGVHNGYLYVITDDYTDPLDVAVGARGEVVVGGVELGFGGLMQADLVPKAIATATGALGDFDLFGELVIQRGTERNLIELDERGRVQVTDQSERDQDWFPAATAGASYLNGDLNLVLAAQYYYNPLGYANSKAQGPAFLCLVGGAGGSGQSGSGGQSGDGPSGDGSSAGGQSGNARAGGNGPADAPRCPTAPDPEPQVVDLIFFGQHYAGASVSWNNIADTDLSASLFWLGNLSDGSGLVRPSLSYQVLDHLRVTLGASLGYAATPAAAEYRDNVAFTLAVSLGAGSF